MKETMENKQTHKIYDQNGNPTKDKPWIFRTYAGHTNARSSNELYRKNLSYSDHCSINHHIEEKKCEKVRNYCNFICETIL